MTLDLPTERSAARVPQATYRLQFHEGFRLRDALVLVPCLHQLGITHLYASPLCMARPHSTHGYDTCDFSRLNPELGTEADLAELVRALRAHHMGLVLDIVPNHMGVGGPENRWWWDVLARGPESLFAGYFDIDWNSPDPRLRGKVLVPVLHDRYQAVLAKGELQIEGGDDSFRLRYGESVFPISAASLKTAAINPAELNAIPEALDALIEKQFYRLTWFRLGDSELNYRRFFNITNLAGLCVEREQVCAEVLTLAQQWARRGWVDGFRVDHADGLRDPEAFLHQLKSVAPNAWIVVEKILEPDESLPASWPVAGTTGYEFLNRAGELFIDSEGAKPLTDVYARFTGNTMDYSELARLKKRVALQTLLAAEVERLTRLLVRLAAKYWRFRDFTGQELRGALTELAACFPVYRSYARPEKGQVDGADASRITQAAGDARRNRPDLPPESFELLSQLLLLQERGDLESEFVARFQQLSAPAMAKGVEDTAFYCYNRFVALNEVGGDPGRFGGGVDEFHQFCLRCQTRWPAAMLATSTHDTKRSEDVRARLSLLSEIPKTWSEAVFRWSAMNKRYRHDGWPDRNAEYLYYQTLVGAWPLPATRALAYMQKAAHEAGEHTCATSPNANYDAALRQFVTATLADAGFLQDLENFVAPLLKPGCINSLAQTILKLAAPGVPDVYQGTELWDLSTADPDNRRPVDFALRQQLLVKAAAVSAEQAWREWPSGLPKLWLIHRALKLRARRPDWFGAAAGYEALTASGYAARHVVAFKRGESLIAVAPRLVIGLRDEWRDTIMEMPAGNWRNELTDDPIPPGPALLRDLLRKFPVALLAREEKP